MLAHSSGRRLRVVLLATALLVAGFALWHYLTLFMALTGARSNLLGVERQLRDVGLEVQPADLELARLRLADARSDVDRASMHFRYDPLIQAGRRAPVLGDQAEGVGHFLTMAGTIVELGQVGADLGDRIVQVQERAKEEPITSFAVQVLEEVRPELELVGVLTERLVDERIALGDAPLLPPLAAARAKLDENLPQLALAAQRGLEARDILPDVLGFNGDRRYLLLALNNGELLPGGGLVSVGGDIVVRNGVASDMDFNSSSLWKEAVEEQGISYIEPPGPLKRYLLRDFSWNIGTSNWSPDYPTWARQALEFYQIGWGRNEYDGVIAIDLEVLRKLLEVTGPQAVTLENGERLRLTPENAVIELERVTREPYERDGDRKAPIGALANVMVQQLLHVKQNRMDDLVEALAQLGHERHLQALFFQEREQALVDEVGWDGALTPTSGDYFQFNESSLNSTKLNLILQIEGRYGIDISSLGDARHELRLGYMNPVDEWARGKDPVLVRKLMYDGQYGGYLRAFTPRGTVGRQVELDGVQRGVEDVGSDGPYDWFGLFMPLLAGQRREAVMRWTVPLATAAPHASSYELLIQKQPGTSGLCLDLAISREGKAATALSIDGGTLADDGRVCLTSDVTVRASFDVTGTPAEVGRR